jgi:hypothetical protein
MAIHILGRHVALGALLEQLQNFEARRGGFEANAFEVVWMCHFVLHLGGENCPTATMNGS